jgi:two-component system NtrC family sensor kinase
MEDLLQSRPHFEEKERFLKMTRSIRQSVDRCSTITHRLLGFARRMDVQIETLNLNDVVMEVYGFLEKEAFHRSIEVRLNLAEDLPEISSDHGQLQQVFINILNNAFTAVEDGGVIGIRSWETEDDFLAVSIEDNGIGMSEETKKHIFDPFFSGHKGSGTGLGLSITYGIIKKLGGSIEVQSKPGEGSTFTVVLPRETKQGTEA